MIPKLVLGGLAILLLSWVVFMAHYVFVSLTKPAPAEAPPRVPAGPAPIKTD